MAPERSEADLNFVRQRSPETWYYHIVDAVQAATVSEIENHSGAKLAALSGTAQSILDNFVKDLEGTIPVACRKGCSWCCSFAVEVAAPEVLAIAIYLRQTLADLDYIAIQERAQDVHDKTRGMTWKQRTRCMVPCSLLVGNACSVYSVRPIQCRGCHSFDARACEASVTTKDFSSLAPAMDWRRKSVTDGTLHGLRDGIDQVGLDGSLLELNAALSIALHDPDDVTRRWLAGEAVFAPAYTTGNGEERR